MAGPVRRATSTGKSAPPAPVGGLSPLQLHAVGILGKEASKWRDALAPGRDQPVDFLLWIKGVIDVEPDTVHFPAQTPKLVEIFAHLFARMGPATRIKARDELLKAFGAGRRPDKPPAEMLEMAQQLVDGITIAPEKPKHGDVRGRDFEVTLVPRGGPCPTDGSPGPAARPGPTR